MVCFCVLSGFVCAFSIFCAVQEDCPLNRDVHLSSMLEGTQCSILTGRHSAGDGGECQWDGLGNEH